MVRISDILLLVIYNKGGLNIEVSLVSQGSSIFNIRGHVLQYIHTNFHAFILKSMIRSKSDSYIYLTSRKTAFLSALWSLRPRKSADSSIMGHREDKPLFSQIYLISVSFILKTRRK